MTPDRMFLSFDKAQFFTPQKPVRESRVESDIFRTGVTTRVSGKTPVILVPTSDSLTRLTYCRSTNSVSLHQRQTHKPNDALGCFCHPISRVPRDKPPPCSQMVDNKGGFISKIDEIPKIFRAFGADFRYPEVFFATFGAQKWLF